MGRAEDIFERVKNQGQEAIDEFLVTRQVEEFYLDFKRSADSGIGLHLHQNDRNNFAKAISGFGNSEGGVIVWGIDASLDIDGSDCARARCLITNVRRFESRLQAAVSGCTIPPHSQIEHYKIDVGSGNGFVASLIPKSQLTPHQCITDYKYYMRAGSSFSPVPHSLIMGMLGRRPQPWVFHNYALKPATVLTRLPGGGQARQDGIQIGITLILANKGPGLARDLFANVKFTVPGPNCESWYEPPDENWIQQRTRVEQWQSIVSKDGFKLAPESHVPSIDLSMVLFPPFADQLWIQLSYGCEGSSTNIIELSKGAADVNRLYNEYINGSRDEAAGKRFIHEVLGIPGVN
jgi:hypothetical protein